MLRLRSMKIHLGGFGGHLFYNIRYIEHVCDGQFRKQSWRVKQAGARSEELWRPSSGIWVLRGWSRSKFKTIIKGRRQVERHLTCGLSKSDGKMTLLPPSGSSSLAAFCILGRGGPASTHGENRAPSWDPVMLTLASPSRRSKAQKGLLMVRLLAAFCGQKSRSSIVPSASILK